MLQLFRRSDNVINLVSSSLKKLFYFQITFYTYELVSSDDIFKVSKAWFLLFGKFRHLLLRLRHCFAEVILAKKSAVTSPKNATGN